MSTSTPWGASQHTHRYAPGIISYSTAGHGGFHLSKRRVDEMPATLRDHAAGCIKPAGDAWMEEDCEWAFVALSFPDFFKSEDVLSAERTLRGYYPNAWEAFYGRKLLPGESHGRDRAAFYETHRERLIAIAAWGSWAEHVPEGSVGVCATIGGQRTSEPAESYWLVPEAEYQARGNFGFVIDRERHTRLNAVLGAHKSEATALA